MPDPQPAFGRFTDLAWEPLPRDEYEWLCAAEELLCNSRRGNITTRQKLALLDRAIECIEQAKGRS
jgi:hypothetical protein